MIDLFLVLKVAQKLTYTERESEGGGVVRQQTDTRCFREKQAQQRQYLQYSSSKHVCYYLSRGMPVPWVAQQWV